MALSEKQKKYLRRLAHPLHPIVMLGTAGLTGGVLLELERALVDHELVKVSVRIGDRLARNAGRGEGGAAGPGSGGGGGWVCVGVFSRHRQKKEKTKIKDRKKTRDPPPAVD